MVHRSIVALALLGSADAQAAGTLTEENHPAMSFSVCDESGCTSRAGAVTIDANWRWTHSKEGYTNCYSGNSWDATLCPDAATCTANCVIEGADAEYASTYGVKASGNSLELDFVTKGQYSTNVGSRTYLMDTDDRYMLFKLKNREFTYTVDDSQLGCGLNGALYFVQMDADGGKSKYGNAGAKYGTGYCDAQCPHDVKFINGVANSEGWVPSATDPTSGKGRYGTCCVEIDIWEANTISTAFTMHACDADGQTRCDGVTCGDNDSGDRFNGICDKNGCDMQSYRLGDHGFFGPGASFKVDSTQPVQVTTQFITDDNTDTGKLVQVKQLYHQNGQTIEHPLYTVSGNQHDSITDAYCSDWVAETQDGTNFLQKGGLSNIETALEAGVVLVMSLWDDHDSNMLWLDSTYPVDSTAPGDARGSCPTSSGVPADVETEQSSAKVVFSDIRVGPIGSTTKGPVPTPTPSPSPAPVPSPTPSPTPTPPTAGTCCWGSCSGDCHADSFCDASADQCTGNCAGIWCSSVLV